MLEQVITTIGFTAWALALYALLPKAFHLHLKQNAGRTKALKQPVRMAWQPGAWAAVSLVVIIALKFSESFFVLN